MLYDGQYQDAESGLYYLRARYYDPQTAQFLTRDPLEAETGAPYSYAGNDPLDMSDPSGLCNKNPLTVLEGGAVGATLSAGEGLASEGAFGYVEFITHGFAFIAPPVAVGVLGLELIINAASQPASSK